MLERVVRGEGELGDEADDVLIVGQFINPLFALWNRIVHYSMDLPRNPFDLDPISLETLMKLIQYIFLNFEHS